MKITQKCLIPAVVALLLTGCSGGLKTGSKMESDASLKSYHTYAWIAPNDPDAVSHAGKIFAPLILTEADAALQKKGMKMDTLQPDAIFVFDSRVAEQVKYSKAPLTTYNYFWGGPGYYSGYAGYGYAGYAGYGPPIPGGDVLPEEYEQGMLAFQMFDAKTRKVLWRGWASKELTGKSDVEADVKRAVRDIFIRLRIKPKQ